MKNVRLLPVLVSVAFVAGTIACSPKKDPEPPKPKVTNASGAAASVAMALPKMGRAPSWKLQDIDGKTVTSEDFKGKVVVVDFWATWCGPCREEIPGYVAMMKKYGKDGLVIVGISVDQGGPEVVKPFSQRYGMNYPLVMADEAVIAAFGGIEAYPTTFLIDRDGQVRDRKIGMEESAEYEKKVLAVLRG